MRTLLLLGSFALITASAFAIEKTSKPQQSQVSSTDAANPPQVQPMPVRPKLKSFVSDGNEVCYTMHSLQVAREPGTDSTRLVRQRTCTPSSQFEMKHTVQYTK